MSLNAVSLAPENGKFTTRPSANAPVQEVLRQAQEELSGLLTQRADLMKRIGTVKQTISGLANLFGEEILNDELMHLVDRKPSGRQSGFTQACRVTLMEAQRPLAVRELCSRMKDRMPALMERHKDPLASLTTVLNRLVEYGEAQSMFDEHGRRAWFWTADSAQAPSFQKDDAQKSVPEHQ
jgi:hypothetical protein